MENMMRFVVVLILLITGCATAGVKIDPAKVAAFEKGKTTYGDVIASLGPPSADVVLPDGSRAAVYTYIQTSARPESFIPYVGLLVGGADSRSSSVHLRFGADGTLVGVTSSNTQAGVSTGLFSGGTATERVAQPR